MRQITVKGLSLLLVMSVLFALPGCYNLANAGETAGGKCTEPSNYGGYPYCMDVVSGNVLAVPTPSGTAWTYSGTITFSFNPALSSSMGQIDLIFNSGSMGGTAMAGNGSQLTFTIANNLH